MAGRPDKMSILKLYKAVLREAGNFPAYNFRMYSLRRVRDGFRANKNLTDAATIQKVYADAQEFMALLRRQATISTLFKTKNLVIENKK